MNRMMRSVIAVIFVAIICLSAISISQNLTRSWRMDITDQKLYTLSQGTKNILAGLNQPLKMKLYYTKTAALKGPDQIRYFNNYYYFVKALLDEYVSASKGKVELQVIDPRPFSDEEVEAIRYGLKRFSITEEENFFFGLVIQTQFGVEKTIDFFSPDRQKFIEYDISYLIDTAVTRDKTRIGVISSLPVVGDDVTGYMAQLMRMQGQQPKQPWAIVSHLKQMYEVSNIDPGTEKIENVDILLVIHPKNFPEETVFAIDQFILGGGRAIICVDPHCVADQPGSMQQMGMEHPTSSDLSKLLGTWGLEVPSLTFAGDRSLAVMASARPNQRPERIIALLSLTSRCFNKDSVISADLNKVKMLFSGVLRRTAGSDAENEGSDIRITPLISTTDRGNEWTVSSQFELTPPDYSVLMRRFIDGTEPVMMGCLVTGRLKSSFPEGIEVPDESAEDENGPSDDQEKTQKTKRLTGLTESSQDCAVIVLADVDFISDVVAYRQSFFGLTPLDDNSALLFNAIEDLAGSSDLISIRSRGNFKRPFALVDQIETQAEAETADEEAKINARIAGFQQELNKVLSSMKDQQAEVIGNTILQQKKGIELEIIQAKRQLRHIKMQKRQRIERLGMRLRNFCTLPGPVVILIIAIILGIRRSVLRRHYISHASDS